MYAIRNISHTSWWHHQMETFAALLALCAGNSPVTVEFPAQRPVTQSFDVFFDLCMNKRLSKQTWGWHHAHYDVTVIMIRTQFCCALFYCGYTIVLKECMWFVYSIHSMLLHWDKPMILISKCCRVTLKDKGETTCNKSSVRTGSLLA